MVGNALDIPDFIAEFMKQPVSKGTPDASLVALYEKLGQADPQANPMLMNQWLTLQLPEVMQTTIDSGKHGAEGWRDAMASTVQDEAIVIAMRKTHLETGDLDRSLPVWKEKRPFIPTSVQSHTADQMMQCIDDQKNQFANTLQYKTFLQNELLPMLHELQRGDQPTNAHKAALDVAAPCFKEPFSGDNYTTPCAL